MGGCYTGLVENKMLGGCRLNMLQNSLPYEYLLLGKLHINQQEMPWYVIGYETVHVSGILCWCFCRIQY
jgi:hypothetical protein